MDAAPPAQYRNEPTPIPGRALSSSSFYFHFSSASKGRRRNLPDLRVAKIGKALGLGFARWEKLSSRRLPSASSGKQSRTFPRWRKIGRDHLFFFSLDFPRRSIRLDVG